MVKYRSKEKKRCTLCANKLDEVAIKRMDQKSEELMTKSGQQTQNERKNLEELQQQKEM